MTDSEKLDFLVEAVARQEKRMDALEENLMGVKSELKEGIQGVKSELKEKIQGVRGELKEEIQGVRGELKEEIQGVRGELKEEIQGVRGELKEEIQGVRGELKEEIQGVKEDVTSLKLVIDNEIRRNISIVAEGHLDLSRKLDEAIKGNRERETLMIRVNALEAYVRELRETRTM